MAPLKPGFRPLPVRAREFLELIAGMTINGEKDADGEQFLQDPFEAVGVLGELIATARQIINRGWRGNASLLPL